MTPGALKKLRKKSRDICDGEKNLENILEKFIDPKKSFEKIPTKISNAAQKF